MNEIWKPVKGYESLYEVSNLGEVKSLKRKSTSKNHYGDMVRTVNEKKLKKAVDGRGYYIVILSNNKNKQIKRVHRLVAEHFIDNTHNLPQVNHKDGNKLNNRVDNLEWCTQKENIIHALKNNLRNTFVKKIAQYDLDGAFIKKWESIQKASDFLKINRSNIGECCRNKRKTAGGYVWKYI